MTLQANQVLSLFGFARASELGEQTPHEDAELFVLGDIAVVYQPVPADEYTGVRGEKNLQDLSWLLPRAERHQEVMAAASQAATVLPVRFGTLFSDWSQVRAWLEQRRDRITDGFNHLEGREEWGVRFLHRQKSQKSETADTRSGSSYLLMKKKLKDQEKDRQQMLGAIGQEIQDLLASLCVDLAKVPIRSFDRPFRQAEGDSRITLAKWAVLIEHDSGESLRQKLESSSRDLLGDQAELELSGPWPPYHFCPNLNTAGSP